MRSRDLVSLALFAALAPFSAPDEDVRLKSR